MTQEIGEGPVRQALRVVWVQISLAIIVGSLLVWLAPENGFWVLLNHLGIGFFVAAIVTLFWHLREMREFFESLARSVLVRDEYLKRLNLSALREIRGSAASAILHKLVENPMYDWQAMERWVDDALFESALPSDKAGSGMYREDSIDNITLEFMATGEVLQELGVPTEGLDTATLQKEVLKATTISRYRVLAPRSGGDYASYQVPLSGRASDVAHIPMEHRAKFYVGNNEDNATEVQLAFDDMERGGITYEAFRSLPLVNGEVGVWTKIVELTSTSSESFVVNTVKNLTHSLHVHLTVSGRPKRLVFEGSVMGFEGTSSGQVDHLPNGITLRYPGWLFEDHGYIIWWWEEGS